MGLHNKICEKAREKLYIKILETIEFTTSDEIREREREKKYLSKKLCFCYDKRIYDF